MRWQIEGFVFCEKQQTLINQQVSNKDTQQLEPMVVELLAYFCRNKDQIISRDLLIEQVWLGRVITDNAVNKVITKLRKIFNDDPKKPRFIATFPKKGYKFIAEVKLVDEEYPSLTAEFITTNQSNMTPTKIDFSKLIILISTLFAVLMIGLFFQHSDKSVKPLTKVKALTRDPGRESRPQVSPNGEYLAYIEVRDKKMHLWIKSLKDENKIEVSHGEDPSIWVDSASWNSDGSALVYLVATQNSCQYFIREFNQLTLGEAKLIHNCPAGSYGKIAFTHDNNRLVYAESEGRNTPFSLFEINLTTKVKKRLNQPEHFLGGNSQFDMHPRKNKLLISSPDKQQWEGFYSLDLETNELKLLFKQDAYICCGIWDHSGERVVLMGEHPANELVSFDLKGLDRQVLYTGSEQVRVPERHINGKDYMFSVVQLNQNALYYDFKNNSSKIIANASVDDRLATFALNNNQVAYISLSSGNEEVWLTDPNNTSRKKLTHFNDSRHYIELLWSYNGDYLLALTLNEIHLINSKTGTSQALKIPQVEIRGLSWKSDQLVSYSIKTETGWRVFYYDITSNSVLPEMEDWQYIRYAKNADDIIWVDQQDSAFVGLNKSIITDAEILQVDVLNGRTFNLKKVADRWSWQNREHGGYQLLTKNNLQVPAKVILDTDNYHFDLSENAVLFHKVETLNADIYQTVSD